MAVPKKRTSKAKTRLRKAHWKRKGAEASGKAYSLAVVALKREEEKRKKEKGGGANGNQL